MTKTLIVFLSLATLAAHSLSASAQVCPPGTHVLMRITGDDSIQYLTSGVFLNQAEEALGTSWNADAAALAGQAFRIAMQPVTRPQTPSTAGVPQGQTVEAIPDVRPTPPRQPASGASSAAATATGVAEPLISGAGAAIVSQPASVSATSRRTAQP